MRPQPVFGIFLTPPTFWVHKAGRLTDIGRARIVSLSVYFGGRTGYGNGMTDTVRFEIRDTIALITLDDGKANALSSEVLKALDEALERAKGEAKAVVLLGRAGRFCAGFDLRVMGSGPAAVIALVSEGSELFLKLYDHPQPVVAACSGHAVAGGAVLLLACDHRVGTQGEFKIGLNEVQIGLPMPLCISEFAKARLANRYLQEATLTARMYNPTDAVAVGFLDEAVAPDSLLESALNRASALARLPARAYASTKHSLREPMISFVRSTLAEDLQRVIAES